MNSRIHHFLLECIAFNQSVLRHEQHAAVIPPFGMDSSDKFCPDLPVKRCEGDSDEHLLLFLMQ